MKLSALLLLSSSSYSVGAFLMRASPSFTTTSTQLFLADEPKKDDFDRAGDELFAGIDRQVITAYTDADTGYDQLQGGVRLTLESAIKIAGDVGAGNEVKPVDILRYKKVTKVDSLPLTNNISVIANGYASAEIGAAQLAAEEALKAIKAPQIEANSLVVNVLGGDDLNLADSMAGIKRVMDSLKVGDDISVIFNSLCHDTFAEGSASVTVVACDETGPGAQGGEIYQYQNQLYTVSGTDINTATE